MVAGFFVLWVICVVGGGRGGPGGRGGIGGFDGLGRGQQGEISFQLPGDLLKKRALENKCLNTTQKAPDSSGF